MQIYEQPKMGIAMFHKENVAVTASSGNPTAPPVINPDAPGQGGWDDDTNSRAVNINDI